MRVQLVSTERHRVALLVMASLLLAPLSMFVGRASAAACAAPSTDYGKVTNSVTVPAAATYRVWTRINVPDTSNNTYLLEIDGDKCYTVGGGSIQAGTWVWIAHQGGNTASKVDVSLSQGAHSLKLIGNKPGVKVDRVIFTSDLNCTPKLTTGDDCNVPSDSVTPVVRITSPTANAEVSGTIAIAATATDNVGVTKVELYVNSSLLGTDTGAPYSFSWDSTKVPNDLQLLTAKAYDAAGNVGTDSFKVDVANGDRTAPSVPTGLSAKATAYDKVTFTWKASTDDTAVAGYTITRDGVPVASVGNVTIFNDSGLFANTTYSYKVQAFDTSGNRSALSSAVSAKTPQVADTQAPTQPTDLQVLATSPNQATLSWISSTDNTGVVGYDIYRALQNGTPAKVGSAPTNSFGDPSLEPNTTYSYYVVARDAAGNLSEKSTSVQVTTPKPPETTTTADIRGTIRNAKNNKSIRHAGVSVVIDGHRHIYQASRRGVYAVQDLQKGYYNLTFRAPDYYSKTTSVKVDGVDITKDVKLQKR